MSADLIAACREWVLARNPPRVVPGLQRRMNLVEAGRAVRVVDFTIAVHQVRAYFTAALL